LYKIYSRVGSKNQVKVEKTIRNNNGGGIKMGAFLDFLCDFETCTMTCTSLKKVDRFEVHVVDRVDKLGRAGVGRFLCRCPAKVKPPPREEMAAGLVSISYSTGGTLPSVF
jgi:hypothetical protein